MTETSRSRPPQVGHLNTSFSKTRRSNSGQTSWSARAGREDAVVPNQVLPGPRNQGGQARGELLGREPEREDFVAQVVALAWGDCTPHRAATAAGHIKRAEQSGGQLPLESSLALERELQAKLFASDDAREGLSAFVEKRSAQFSNT